MYLRLPPRVTHLTIQNCSIDLICCLLLDSVEKKRPLQSRFGSMAEKKRSWTCTVITQVCLCVALYFALNIGNPQQQPLPHHDIVFITVRGGFRPVHTQTHLLKQIEDVARVYRAKFVVNISELGEEEDPLTRNASQLPSNVPWYTTKASEGQICFEKHVDISDDGPSLDIVGLNTGSLQDLLLRGSVNGSELGRTLETATGNWSIVFGYHPIIHCDENDEQVVSTETLHRVFVKHGVSAYLSTNGGCLNHTSRDGVDYIGIVGPGEEAQASFSSAASNRKLDLNRKKMGDGFLVHRVTSLEIITYFISSEGKVMNRVVTQQKGKAAI
ncbi:hypothetical protein LINPERPRIM_LOCUS14074 [Linum perenne]